MPWVSSPAKPAQQESGRYGVLDALRGLGAMQVVTFHYVLLTNSGIAKLPIVYNSWVSLEFFFVLSGFVIALVYRNKVRDLRSTLGFVVRRFGRIWPLHFVVLTSFVAAITLINVALDHPHWLNISTTDGPYSLVSLVSEFFLWNAMGLWKEPNWYVPAWSIGAEFYVYMIFGIVCLVARRTLALTAAATAAVAIATLASWSPSYLDTDSQFGLFRCMGSFFFGVVVLHCHQIAAGRWIQLDNAPKTAIGTVFEVAFLVLVATFCAYLDTLTLWVPWISLVSPLIFFWVVFIFSFERGWVSYLLDRKMFRTLGDLSFSMYATHWPILILVLFGFWQLREKLGIDVGWWLENSRLISLLGFFPFLAIVLMVSRFTNRVVEVPWRSKFATLGRRIEGSNGQRARTRTVG
jgi:peptidoglycan/LPS O-acetylase OafA/YrhL